jgi:hypothetical protein
VENESSLDTLAQQYFFTLFTSSQPGSITQVIQHVNRVVSQDMNDYLLQEFSVEDVHNALMQMFPTKAPGLDGMIAQFFQKILAYCGYGCFYYLFELCSH